MRRVLAPLACAALAATGLAATGLAATGLVLPASAGAAPSGTPVVDSAPAAAVLAAKVNPERANRKPDQDLGYYLGYPTPTYRWHGCTMTSTYRAPTPQGSEPDPIGSGAMPAPKKGTKQGKVRFTTVSSNATHGWTIRWEVKNPAKFKICGVQVSGGFARVGVSERYVAQAGYTSTAKKGSTVTNGPETFKLRVPKNSRFSFAIPAQYENKKLDTKIIYAVTVFITKKK